MTPITRYIERNGSRLIISEHQNECFIATEKPMFLDLAALDALLEEAWVIRRRLRARSPSSPYIPAREGR